MKRKDTPHMVSMREKILEAIIGYIQEHGYAPSVREIGEMVELKSTSSIEHYLYSMFQCGMLETDHVSAPRAIRVPGYKFVKIGADEA